MPEGMRYGSDQIVELLARLGFEYVAFNPGASFRGIHDSLVNYPCEGKPEPILCCHEEISVAMAHGYYKATGRPMVAILHDLVGLQHAAMAIYNAWCDRVPVFLLGGAGPMDVDLRRPQIDWVHTALVQGNLVRDFVKWDDQPFTLKNVPESLLRANKIMLTPPNGPVYIAIDVTFQEEICSSPGLPDVSRFAPPEAPAPPGETLARVARMLVNAQHPVIIADMLGRTSGGTQSLVELAEMIGAPVIDYGNSVSFPSNHPLNLTGAEELLLPEADLVLAFEVKDLYGAFYKVNRQTREKVPLINSGAQIISIGVYDLFLKSWSTDFERMHPVDLSLAADPAVAIRGLADLCGSMKNSFSGIKQSRVQKLEETHRKLRQKWLAEALKQKDLTPIAPAWLVQVLGELIKDEQWVLVNESTKGWPRKLWDMEKPRQYLGINGGGGLGYGPGASLGAALGLKDQNVLCIDIQADGDLLFTPSALWTAAHYQIPLLMVIHNNRSYYNSQNHGITMAKTRGRPIERSAICNAIDEPAVDFVMLARSFGLHAEGPVTQPDKLKEVLARAIKVVKEDRKTVVVEVSTQPR